MTTNHLGQRGCVEAAGRGEGGDTAAARRPKRRRVVQEREDRLRCGMDVAWEVAVETVRPPPRRERTASMASGGGSLREWLINQLVSCRVRR